MVRSWAWTRGPDVGEHTPRPTSPKGSWRTRPPRSSAKPDQIALAVDHAGLTDPNCAPIYRGRGELIDHIFASHRLVNPDNVPAAETVAATPLPSMTDDPSPQPPAPSDHAAVVATFNI
jgi:hypothetical protein